MRLWARALVLIALALLPAGAQAGTVIGTATTTLTVTLPPRPLVGEVTSSCAFVVVQGGHKATCWVTVSVADPTAQNDGWKLGLSVSGLTCTCGGTLPPSSLTIQSSNGPTLINGQPVSAQGGPKLQANSVGQSATPHNALLVAKPGYGNGAYTVAVELRLSYPANAKPGTYVPTWVVEVEDY